MLSLLPLPILVDNYVWLLKSEDDLAVVVDPGAAEPVLGLIEQGLRIAAILVTHHHPDHLDGLPSILRAHPTPVYAPHDSRIAQVTHRVEDGDRVEIAEMDLSFQVIAVPGHTLSHVAYYDGARVFCGDTLFSLGCGRLFEGTPGQMLDSLDRLAALPAETAVCCAHEYTESNARFALHVDPHNPALMRRSQAVSELRRRQRPSLPSTIGSERECNPFLRIDSPALRAAVANRTLEKTGDRIARFAELRRWKDEFRAS
jgi:hydroxyacylglutathione hydrolase